MNEIHPTLYSTSFDPKIVTLLDLLYSRKHNILALKEKQNFNFNLLMD